MGVARPDLRADLAVNDRQEDQEDGCRDDNPLCPGHHACKSFFLNGNIHGAVFVLFVCHILLPSFKSVMIQLIRDLAKESPLVTGSKGHRD